MTNEPVVTTESLSPEKAQEIVDEIINFYLPYVLNYGFPVNAYHVEAYLDNKYKAISDEDRSKIIIEVVQAVNADFEITYTRLLQIYLRDA